MSKSHSVVSDSLRPRGLYNPWNSPGQNTGVGSCSLLQRIFPTQGSNVGLLHCRQILYQLSHQGRLEHSVFSKTCPPEKLFYQSPNYWGFMRASPAWEKKGPSQAASNLPHEGKEIPNSKLSTKSTRAASCYQNLNDGRPCELSMMTMTMPKKLISKSFCL